MWIFGRMALIPVTGNKMSGYSALYWRVFCISCFQLKVVFDWKINILSHIGCLQKRLWLNKRYLSALSDFQNYWEDTRHLLMPPVVALRLRLWNSSPRESLQKRSRQITTRPDQMRPYPRARSPAFGNESAVGTAIIFKLSSWVLKDDLCLLLEGHLLLQLDPHRPGAAMPQLPEQLLHLPGQLSLLRHHLDVILVLHFYLGCFFNEIFAFKMLSSLHRGCLTDWGCKENHKKGHCKIALVHLGRWFARNCVHYWIVSAFIFCVNGVLPICESRGW